MMMRRKFGFPSAETFSIPPIHKFVSRWIHEPAVVVDPFSGNSGFGTLTNDLNPATTAEYHHGGGRVLPDAARARYRRRRGAVRSAL